MYYFSCDKIERMRIKWYLVTFCIMSVLVCGVFYKYDTQYTSHSGNVFRYNLLQYPIGTFAYPEIVYNVEDSVLIPEDRWFALKTNHTSLDEDEYITCNLSLVIIDIDISNISQVLINATSADNPDPNEKLDYDYPNLFSEKYNLSLYQSGKDVKGNHSFTMHPPYVYKDEEVYFKDFVYYFFQIEVGLNLASSKVEVVLTIETDIIELCSSCSEDYDYSYTISESTELFTNNYLAVMAAVMLFSYLFLLALSFVWQKFEPVNIMFILYLFVGIIALFWYIGEAWATKGVSAGVDLSWLNFLVPQLTYILLIIICVFQWSFTIGMILGIMFFITKAFSALFMASNIAGFSGGGG